jgi:hypothetical protein
MSLELDFAVGRNRTTASVAADLDGSWSRVGNNSDGKDGEESGEEVHCDGDRGGGV